MKQVFSVKKWLTIAIIFSSFFSSAIGEEKVGKADKEMAALEASIPVGERKNSYIGIKTDPEKLLFLAYATTLPIGILEENNNEYRFITDSELVLVKNWPSEMKRSLDSSRKEKVIPFDEFKDAKNANQVLALITKAYAKSDVKRETYSDTDFKRVMLPYDVEFTVYLRLIGLREATSKKKLIEQESHTTVNEVTDSDLAKIKEILLITRRGKGVIPKNRDLALLRIDELVGQLTPALATAIAPSVNYEIAGMFWSTWGNESPKKDTAIKYFRSAARAYNGKFSSEALSYYCTLANTATDEGKTFLEYHGIISNFEKNGTINDLFPYNPIDTVIARNSVIADNANAKERLLALKVNARVFLDVMTDKGTLKRFEKSKSALEYISLNSENKQLLDAAKELIKKNFDDKKE